jgi:hypothetical protein
LTSTETYNTPTPSPTESPGSHVGESVLRPMHSYSDVVQMRSVTPQPGAGVHSASVNSAAAETREGTPSREPELSNKIDENPFLSTSESSSDDNNSPWTTADHRRHKSKKDPPISKDLVVEAEKLLTEDEKKRIHNQRHVEEKALSQEPTPSTLDEGPSKGKNIDPRNWGDAGLEESDLDVKAQ